MSQESRNLTKQAEAIGDIVEHALDNLQRDLAESLPPYQRGEESHEFGMRAYHLGEATRMIQHERKEIRIAIGRVLNHVKVYIRDANVGEEMADE